MRARKLPSGSWRVRVYSHTDASGRKIYKSFTCADPSPKGKRICEREAAAWAANREDRQSPALMTFGAAAEEYIALRESVLSPTTVDSYRHILKRYLVGLSARQITHITSKHVQQIINEYSAELSPKTIRNIHGFISVVMKEYRPDFALRVKLPKKKPTDQYIPTDADVKKLIGAARGTQIELPILLAAFGPMRRGEIAALRSENISGNIVHVCENMVKKIVDGKNTWIIKQPKSAAGDRYIEYPSFVAELWQGKEGRVCELCPDTITKVFIQLLDKTGLPHFRFHDLRHYSASIQHAMGVPDQYIMLRGGWGTDRTLKSVYRHSLPEQVKEQNAKINSYFEDVCHEI
jgi:integrase